MARTSPEYNQRKFILALCGMVLLITGATFVIGLPFLGIFVDETFAGPYLPAIFGVIIVFWVVGVAGIVGGGILVSDSFGGALAHLQNRVEDDTE